MGAPAAEERGVPAVVSISRFLEILDLTVG